MANQGKKFAKLKCEQCGRVNYRLHKSNQVEEKLELKKFCKHCREHTTHKEK